MEESCVAATEFFEELAHSSFESGGVHIQEMRRAFVNESQPRPVILIGVAYVNVTLRNELLDGSDDLRSLIRCGSLLRCGHWPVPLSS
jgi:hypothetical protein